MSAFDCHTYISQFPILKVKVKVMYILTVKPLLLLSNAVVCGFSIGIFRFKLKVSLFILIYSQDQGHARFAGEYLEYGDR